MALRVCSQIIALVIAIITIIMLLVVMLKSQFSTSHRAVEDQILHTWQTIHVETTSPSLEFLLTRPAFLLPLRYISACFLSYEGSMEGGFKINWYLHSFFT